MKSDPLSRYKEKRDFSITPEPAGAGHPSAGVKQFVIQKHWATRLHYDLRLEIDGTMKSWAVPKGPSLDPADKRMAVQVEDHPISYNSFEGVIPPRQYGAGRVIVWDKGFWEPVGDAAEGWRKGHLKFLLHGHKLHGRWALVRIDRKADSAKPTWLLIKEHDGHERPSAEYSVVDSAPDSVAHLPSVQPVPPIPAHAKEPPASAASQRQARKLPPAPKAPLPSALSPQLATLVAAPPPDAEQWMYELKFDGYRILSRIQGKRVQLITRNGHDWTHKVPHLVEAIQALHVNQTWLDGEIVAVDAQGTPDFQKLQNAFDGSDTSGLVYYLFDMPFADGLDLRTSPLEMRRDRLRQLLAKNTSDSLRLSETFEAPPQTLVASACKIGFEGVIGKRKASTYISGRNSDWIKLKCGLRQEFVIGGYTKPKGSRNALGALLLGVYDEQGRLQHAGNVGSGFTEQSLQELKEELRSLHSQTSPFAGPSSPSADTHWVHPQLVAEVAFAQWTQGHRIRHSVFKGLRKDKPARDIRREEASQMTSTTRATTASPQHPATASGLEPRISHGDRVIDPSTGFTKMDLVHYYSMVGPLMMEHLAARPVALVRAPTGVPGELFFQKHQESDALAGISALHPSLDEGHAPLLEVASAQGLRSGSQMNVIEYHTWNALKDKIERPDRMTFDLDPGEGAAWEQVQEGARLVRVLLKELGLPAFLKTSGGKGLHVVVPIKRLRDWDTVKDFSKAIVVHLADAIPQRFVAKSGPRNRVGKIFVDYLRNGRGATTVSAWSARARPGMGVSVPVSWNELEKLVSGAHWNVRNIEQRLRAGNGPWEGYRDAAVSLTPAMKALGFRPG